MRRREFLGTSPSLLLGAPFACASALQSQTARRGPDLRDELSTAEIETVNKSVMAKDVDNFFGKGFS